LTLYNELEVFPSGMTKLAIEGEGAGALPTDRTNLVLLTFQKASELAGKDLLPVRILCRNRIPLARGMGSSAAVLVSAAIAANRILGEPLSKHQILQLVVKEEGHSDNVAPALLGGLVVSGLRGGEPVTQRILPERSLKVVLLVPDFHMETSKARLAMPAQIPLKDAVTNLQNTALTAMAFATGDYSLLESSLEDKLHQPYRKQWIPGFDEVLAAAKSAGAYGAALSGAGPTLAAFTMDRPEAVAEAMEAAYREKGKGDCKTLILDVDHEGAVVEELDS
jgi:homoserine kinase